MSKEQIRLTQNEIRRMISEAIRNYDTLGNPKYPEGVFSTDSEEGEALKDYTKSYEKPEDGDSLMWDKREMKLKDAKDNVTGEKWSDTPNSVWDTDKKLDKLARDEFGDEEKQGQLYDKPFGDLDDAENQWKDEPGYEEDDDEDIAGINEGKVTLTEESLRNFISYSVSELLKEAYGRPFSDGRGGIEYEDSKYGSDSMEIEFNPWEDDSQMEAFQSVIEEAGLQMDMFDDGGQFGDIWPISVNVHYTVSQGMKGDYDTPDDPDEIEVTGWDADTNDLQPQVGQLVDKVLQTYFNDGYFDPEEQIGARGLYEENLGTTVHFNGESSFKPENPYKDMSWDEYCEAKRMEREKDQMKSEKPEEDEKPNIAVTTHFDGEKHEKTPEEMEDEKHMFDDDYWVNKMNLSKDELSEIVKKTVKKIMEEIEAGNEGAQVVDNFPKKASGTFTMRTGRGNVDKYKVYVEKTEEEELLTDIFVYDERGNEWEPQAEYVVGIEEYKDGSWLPYWETFNGDVSIRALANCFDKVVKLWKKVGYLYDEDDEIPFRYAGDYMKGAPKGMF